MKLEGWRTKLPPRMGRDIKDIYVGECPSREIEQGHNSPVTPTLAHTHMCPNDEYQKSICIYEEWMILDSDGYPSKVMWHEYAHVLDAKNWRFDIISCGATAHAYTGGNTSIMEFSPLGGYSGHTTTWMEIMKSLGQEPSLQVPRPTGKDKYKGTKWLLD